MSKVCRCCLIEGSSMKNLFSFRIKCKNGEEDVSFAEAYNLNTNLQISKDSKLPFGICLNCEEKLIVSYKFRIQCRTANTMLSLRSSDVDIKNDDDFWDDEFLYNVPRLFKGDFFGKETHSAENQLPCTYEINSTDCDISVEKPTIEDDDDEEDDIEEIFDEPFDENPMDPIDKRTCFKCTACRRTFSKHYFYRVHSEKVHNLDWECEYCEERFTSETYSAHKRMHTTEPVFICGHCNAVYNSQNSFGKHRCPGLIPEDEPKEAQAEPPESTEVDDYFDDTPTTPLQYSCNVCKEDFTSNKKYKIHIKGHEKLALKNKTDKGYLCNFCGLELTRADSLISHIRTHTGEKPYGCDICGKYFRQRCSLRNHKQLHTGKQTMCELCPKTFASRAFLRLHMRSHNNERNFKCEVCNKSYLMKHALKEHNRAHHSSIRFKCSYCDKDFTNPSRKKLHETIHTGKRWWCTICDYKATRKNRLKGHIFAIHKLNIDDLNIQISETGTAEIGVETAEDCFNIEEELNN